MARDGFLALPELRLTTLRGAAAARYIYAALSLDNDSPAVIFTKVAGRTHGH